MTTIIDFSAGPPPAEEIRAAGHTGAVLYLSDGREPWMTGKNPTRAYLDSLDAAGIKFAFVWQFRKGGSIDSGDAGRGYDGGYADATEALRRLNALRCAGHPVFFAVDWDITLAEWNARVADYFRGAAAKLGRERVGIYGHSRVLHWALEDRVVAEVEPGKRILGWQTRSWSNGVVARDYAVLYQREHNVPGPAGVQIDVNEPLHPEWGWRGVQIIQKPAPHVDLAPVEFPCDMTIDCPDSGWRDPHKVQAGVVHTTENQDISRPEDIANWQRNPANQSSYNVLFGADDTGAKTVRTNPDNRRPWAAGEPGNTLGCHGACVGYAKKTRADWLRDPQQLENVAQWAADLHLRYGLPLVWLSPEEVRAGKRGFTSHGNWYLGKGGPAHRTDPGAGFPHDLVLARAQEIVNNSKKEDFLMALTDDEQRELLTLARSIDTQLQGPNQNSLPEKDRNPKGGRGWRQLGSNAAGQWLTLVDALAHFKQVLTDLVKRVEKLEEKR